VGVALLVPPPVAAEIDGLRRALGDGALGRIPAHLTLVPPVNVREDALADALAVLRAAASKSGPVDLRIGPAATFLPVTPVVYLTVGGDVDALHTLRERVFHPPLARELTHPFVPHVTVADDMDPARIPAAVVALADFVVDVRIGEMHLLEERRGHVWEPIADVPLSRRWVADPATERE
jgi:2'-5' RNA ligase